MQEIELTKSYVALVDDEDYDRLMRCNWHVFQKDNMHTIYAYRDCYLNGRPSSRAMHVEIMGTRPGFYVDHKDRNGLNNCRSNLRFATQSQNCANSIARVNSSSRFKGVSWAVDRCKWRAWIMCEYTSYTLGSFVLEEDAARAYNTKALELFGEFARLNVIEPVNA